MFQGAPPRFDHGIREFQLLEGHQSAQDARVNQFVDLGVHILHARIRQHDRGSILGRRGPTRVEQHGQRTRPRRLRLAMSDRWLWVWLSGTWNAWRTAIVIVNLRR
jgi:hypothetical protein